MAKAPKHVPHWMVLVQLAHAAEANARELITDGEALSAAGHWPRAYALAVLAHEEFGKALMAIAFVTAPRFSEAS
jgi:AbiV family abortive infection protein